ncbi:hypothetical protein VCHA53O466_50182 [Vibrio chagasii]|nr:hypothetical protein VCHA53O466_50182 [Vibrio chagasii]
MKSPYPATYEVKSLASSRSILSIIKNLDKVDGISLKLKKGEITHAWASSKSSRRDIAVAASELCELNIVVINSDGSKDRIPFAENVEVSTQFIEFTFSEAALKLLSASHDLLFTDYSVEDFVKMSSRFTLNTLILSLWFIKVSDGYVSYDELRSAMDAEDEYEHKQAFYRHVVQPAFKDLSALPTSPLTYEVYSDVNPETKREMSYGIYVKKNA